MAMKWRFSRPLLVVRPLDVDLGCTRRRQYGMGLTVGRHVLGAGGLFAALLCPNDLP
jgi:hypothetical protein